MVLVLIMEGGSFRFRPRAGACPLLTLIIVCGLRQTCKTEKVTRYLGPWLGILTQYRTNKQVVFPVP